MSELASFSTAAHHKKQFLVSFNDETQPPGFIRYNNGAINAISKRLVCLKS